jgi:hypothetical protein
VTYCTARRRRRLVASGRRDYLTREANGAELATYVIEKGKPFIVLAED